MDRTTLFLVVVAVLLLLVPTNSLSSRTEARSDSTPNRRNFREVKRNEWGTFYQCKVDGFAKKEVLHGWYMCIGFTKLRYIMKGTLEELEDDEGFKGLGARHIPQQVLDRPLVHCGSVWQVESDKSGYNQFIVMEGYGGSHFEGDCVAQKVMCLKETSDEFQTSDVEDLSSPGEVWSQYSESSSEEDEYAEDEEEFHTEPSSYSDEKSYEKYYFSEDTDLTEAATAVWQSVNCNDPEEEPEEPSSSWHEGDGAHWGATSVDDRAALPGTKVKDLLRSRIDFLDNKSSYDLFSNNCQSFATATYTTGTGHKIRGPDEWLAKLKQDKRVEGLKSLASKEGRRWMNRAEKRFPELGKIWN